VQGAAPLPQGRQELQRAEHQREHGRERMDVDARRVRLVIGHERRGRRCRQRRETVVVDGFRRHHGDEQVQNELRRFFSRVLRLCDRLKSARRVAGKAGMVSNGTGQTLAFAGRMAGVDD
jgi:hypothetical protein